MLKQFHRLISPKYFYNLAVLLTPWFAWLTALLMIAGLYGGLVFAPADYQQGESFRIIYVHVPSAWMSLFIYIVMAVAGGVGLIWHIKIADVLAKSCAPVGASFTFLALATGSLWGKPMWGTWWVWDARLTSESDRNIPSSERLEANNAVIQIIPAVTLLNNSGSEPNANGNKTMTIIKKISGLASSARYLDARIISRKKITLKTFQ